MRSITSTRILQPLPSLDTPFNQVDSASDCPIYLTISVRVLPAVQESSDLDPFCQYFVDVVDRKTTSYFYKL
uniref:Uncharacterized protein n=1 Tax=Lepeophtheirus salmonis TaxID=72036 RepID=A0A0K2UWL6_LEPSM